MKKLAKFLFSSAFIVYLVIALDFFPLEMHFNILDWDGKRLVKFVMVFLIALFFCRRGLCSPRNAVCQPLPR